METKDVILELRTKKGLSQDELAGKEKCPSISKSESTQSSIKPIFR